MNITREITLEEHRCYDCGRFWLTEHGFRGRCPTCADRQIERADKERMGLERRVNALRGVVSRLSKKAKQT